MKKIFILTTWLMMAITMFAADKQKEHTVERGETITTIAKLYNITPEALLKANPMAKDMLYAGMILTIPDAESVTETQSTPMPKSNGDAGTQNKESENFENNSQTLYIPSTYNYGSGYDKSIDFGIGIQANAGMSTFNWDSGNVNGTFAYGGDLFIDMLFNECTLFIPSNWLMEFDLGYIKKGASSFDMSYIHAQIFPLGYRIPIYDLGLSIKGGVEVGYPLGDFDGRWSADLQVGVCVGVKLELGRFGIGCKTSYDFTQVSSGCGQTLNNLAVLGTISYKFAKF